MPEQIVRSASDGQLKVRPICKYHHSIPHYRTSLLQKTSPPCKTSSKYGSSDYFLSHEEKFSRARGSYWSPSISENEYHFERFGRNGLNRRIRLFRLISFLLQMGLVIMQIQTIAAQFSVSANDAKLYACTVFAGYFGAAFLSAVFAPVIFSLFPDQLIICATCVTTTFYVASRLLAVDILIQLPAAMVCGWCAGLMVVKQGIWALNLGVQYSCVENLKEQKTTAGDWYLYSQVVCQCAGLFGCLLTGHLMPSWNYHTDADKQCGKRACDGPLTSFDDRSFRNWTVGAERQLVKSSMIDEADDHANKLLSVMATAVALTASACCGLAFCLNRLSKLATWRRRTRGPTSRCGRQSSLPESNRMDDGNKKELSVNSETTQIYTESPVHQLHHLLRLLFCDHKLQTLLPLVFFTGLQSAFITMTFTTDFVGCSLGKKFIGWTMSSHYGAFCASFWIVFKASRQSKRLYILFWIVLFQLGIGAVVIVWLPVHHDIPMFFIVTATFGVVEGALFALISGLLVRMFAHDWLGFYSYIVAFKFSGFLIGICSSIFLCAVAQMYLLYGVLGVALIPYFLLEWRYNSFLHRSRQNEANYL